MLSLQNPFNKLSPLKTIYCFKLLGLHMEILYENSLDAAFHKAQLIQGNTVIHNCDVLIKLAERISAVKPVVSNFVSAWLLTHKVNYDDLEPYGDFALFLPKQNATIIHMKGKLGKVKW